MSYIQTKRWNVNKSMNLQNKEKYLQEAAQWIKQGNVVAFPTETVYGLGGNALDSDAVKEIFRAKGRPNDNPLIVHIADRAQLDELVTEIPEVAEKLMKAYWPGPLTLIFKASDRVPSDVTAGLDTVAVRMPSHPVARELLLKADVPVAAPSANLSGRPSPTTADHVWTDLAGRIAGVIDGGPTGVGLESTVLDISGQHPVIFRPGGITLEQIAEVAADVELDQALVTEGQAPKSPGMKYTHYAPKGSLTLVRDPDRIHELVASETAQGNRVGVLTTENRQHKYKADFVFACGADGDLAKTAALLYNGLRQFDDHHIDVIYSEVFPESGVGAAVMNRLLKAAGGRIIE
ncbi:L-threonylcarbamoyladenylate synthase [Alkalicoccobacillus plakortidis]|uniref:Threonylcarbamoyl-AMP synthase n=1 Tax=Alkalicoccobacillus plakortidis TaxID=444060 RepID=A0ABT0XJR6_9BACI|nr:L-threonylcarbamoyladenylate synthase [Alkalicoccobacillus plakortidis]MCM2675970.1 L-threonylcarbamoyladenylate synthase [Alkalicoccobacillus plakortidis]